MGKKLAIVFIIITALCIAFMLLYMYKQSQVLDYVMSNSLQCGKPKCDIIVDPNMPVLPPSLKNEEDSLNFFKSLINFEAILIKVALENKNFVPGTVAGMNVIKQIDSNDHKCFGVIASLDSNPDIVVLAFRGTQTLDNLLEDTHFAMVPFPVNSQSPIDSRCHQGFVTMYNELKDQVYQNIPKTTKIVIILGHSLGAAVACLFGSKFEEECGIPATVVTYACPRIGNKDFCDFATNKLGILRFRNESDVVPSFPAAVSPNEKTPSQPFIYYSPGSEVTFNYNWKSVMNNHMIPVYMYYFNTIIPGTPPRNVTPSVNPN